MGWFGSEVKTRIHGIYSFLRFAKTHQVSSHSVHSSSEEVLYLQ